MSEFWKQKGKNIGLLRETVQKAKETLTENV